jgi:hypothetical protein
MERYKNLSGNSGALAYKIEPDSIIVQFQKGGTYSYSGQRPGSHYVEKMKKLAVLGRGLNTFINTTPEIKNRYHSKLN